LLSWASVEALIVVITQQQKTRIDGANVVTLNERKHRYVALAKRARINGANTVAMMFITATCDKFQADRFITYMGEWEAAKDQGPFGQQKFPGRSYLQCYGLVQRCNVCHKI